MKIMRMTKLGIILAICIAAAGCVGETVKFNMAENQKYDTTKGRSVMSDACGFQLLLVIPININDRQQRAYEELVRQAGKDYIVTDIRVQERWYWALVGTAYCTEFEAMAYPKTVASAGTATTYSAGTATTYSTGTATTSSGGTSTTFSTGTATQQ